MLCCPALTLDFLRIQTFLYSQSNGTPRPIRKESLEIRKNCSGPISWLVHQVKFSLTWLHPLFLFNSSLCSQGLPIPSSLLCVGGEEDRFLQNRSPLLSEPSSPTYPLSQEPGMSVRAADMSPWGCQRLIHLSSPPNLLLTALWEI